jgi:hypothetical protein
VLFVKKIGSFLKKIRRESGMRRSSSLVEGVGIRKKPECEEALASECSPKNCLTFVRKFEEIKIVVPAKAGISGFFDYCGL